MANNNNLRVPTPTEARKNGRKGGIASGKARRRKKEMRSVLNDLLSMPLNKGSLVNIDTVDNIANLKKANITAQEKMMLAVVMKAIDGNVKAAEFIRDTLGERQVDQSLNVRIIYGENELE